MTSALFEVNFKVQVSTETGEVVYIVGDCPQLGNWKPQGARRLQREYKKIAANGGEAWQTTIKVPADLEIKYRYFCARTFDANDDGEECDIVITRWETNRRPRSFIPKIYCLNPQDCHANVAEFGHYDGRYSIDKGWLTTQTEIHLHLHNEPLQFWKKRHQEQTYQIKCTAMDLRHRDSTTSFDDEDEDQSRDVPLDTGGTEVKVSVLSSNPENNQLSQVQHSFGQVYHQGDFLIFKAQTFAPEFLGFKLDFYLHTKNGSPQDLPKHVGYAYILPVNLKESHSGTKMVPISGLKHMPIGQITFHFLVIKPMLNHECDMSVSYARHWKHQRRPLDVGHRGMGPSYGPKKLAAVRENTIASLTEAASHGADMVEFDIQLSKDLVPVIYHDFRVLLTLRKKTKDQVDVFEVPVKDLTLEQLQQLKLDHTAEKDSAKAHQHDHVDPEDLHPFPTLAEAFASIDPHVGFNIEIKYAMQLKTGTYEEDHYPERNAYIDIMLKDILLHAGQRRIIFSCFDPDVCTMLRLKQNKYPVLFLTMGQSSRWESYYDCRTHSIKYGACYAQEEQILGINVHAEEILKSPDIIQDVKNMGLIVFCWGEDNNDTKNIKFLKEKGVSGVIYDRISDYKPTEGNIFKMEHQSKLRLLQKVGAIDVERAERQESTGSDSSDSGSPVEYGKKGIISAPNVNYGASISSVTHRSLSHPEVH